MLMSIYIFSHLIKISLCLSIIRQFIYMLNIATCLLYYMSLHIAFMEILSIKLMATYLSNINCSFTFCDITYTTNCKLLTDIILYYIDISSKWNNRTMDM